MSGKVRVLEFLQDNTKNKPNEDSLFASREGGLFAVADGVTRFVPQGKEYPNPSPASTVSEIFCLEAATQLTTARSEKMIREVFGNANELICRFNEGNGITKETTDYLENDFAGCVGVLGALTGNTLYYGYIGDCGLLVCDSSTLAPIFITGNDLDMLEDFRDALHMFIAPRESKEARMLYWNQFLRNRPEERYLTFGSLTGQEEALAYVKTGSVTLSPKDVAVFFSDGVMPYLFSRSFRDTLGSLMYNNKHSSEKESELKAEIERNMPQLRKLGFKNLDDDKAFIALQLT